MSVISGGCLLFGMPILASYFYNLHPLGVLGACTALAGAVWAIETLYNQIVKPRIPRVSAKQIVQKRLISWQVSRRPITGFSGNEGRRNWTALNDPM
jgi:hypothetical protein